MADIEEFLDKAISIDGAVGVALVDAETGMCLGAKGGGTLDMELAGASSLQIVEAAKGIIDQLNLDQSAKEALLTMEGQYHLIRLFQENQTVYSYLILDAQDASLALARTQLRSIDQDLSLDALDPAHDGLDEEPEMDSATS